MSLTPGDRLGAYEIIGLLGAGGMGEVYRARDTRLKREVAIKILPEAFASDPDRLARFQREAELLASLNHPNIAGVFGLEQRALVLELVEGETLADRIARGPLPLDEALPIAREIADALEAAHERGIIHRDLKPANIKVTPDGKVKVLDFGLAKALGPAEAGHYVPNASHSPTITSPAMMTGGGMILGTAAYMSPEQARGKPVDRRSDIWAFACVLYEMLSGKRPFDGDDVTEVLARIIEREPDWKLLPATTPPSIRRLLRRALEKDRRRRLGDAGDARLDIDEALTSPAEAPGARPSRRINVGAVAAMALLSALAAGAAVWAVDEFLRGPQAGEPVTFSIEPPADVTFPGTGLAISPDGRHVAFLGSDHGADARVWVRSLDSLDARPLSRDLGGSTYVPFWSPDSRWVAYFADGKLKKASLAGGPAQEICDLGNSTVGIAMGTWGADGTIIFSLRGSGLMRVSASGGQPIRLAAPDPAKNETEYLGPSFLPDGKRFLYFSQPSNTVFLGAIDSTQRESLLKADSRAVYAAPGYLLFLRQSNLMGQAFDGATGKVRGEAFPIAQNVGLNANTGATGFSASDNGVLVYRTGSPTQAQIALLDLSGRRVKDFGEPGDYRDLDVSPDGTRVVVHRHEDLPGGGLWVFDTRHSTMTRLTFDASHNENGHWSPNGDRVAFTSNRNGGVSNIYRKLASGAGPDELVYQSAEQKVVTDWSPDGRFLVYSSQNAQTSLDIWTLPLTGSPTPVAFLNTPSAEGQGRLSPNGHWMAYVSNESGRNEVYVQPFPPSGGKWQISTVGGTQPRWRPDGKALYFLATKPGSVLSARGVTMVAVSETPTFNQGPATEILTTDFAQVTSSSAPLAVTSNTTTQSYALTPDWAHLVILANGRRTITPTINVLLNWTASLKQ